MQPTSWGYPLKMWWKRNIKMMLSWRGLINNLVWEHEDMPICLPFISLWTISLLDFASNLILWKVENLVNSFHFFLSVLPWKEFIFMVMLYFLVNQNDTHVEQKRYKDAIKMNKTKYEIPLKIVLAQLSFILALWKPQRMPLMAWLFMVHSSS